MIIMSEKNYVFTTRCGPKQKTNVNVHPKKLMHEKIKLEKSTL